MVLGAPGEKVPAVWGRGGSTSAALDLLRSSDPVVGGHVVLEEPGDRHQRPATRARQGAIESIEQPAAMSDAELHGTPSYPGNKWRTWSRSLSIASSASVLLARRAVPRECAGRPLLGCPPSLFWPYSSSHAVPASPNHIQRVRTRRSAARWWSATRCRPNRRGRSETSRRRAWPA